MLLFELGSLLYDDLRNVMVFCPLLFAAYPFTYSMRSVFNQQDLTILTYLRVSISIDVNIGRTKVLEPISATRHTLAPTHQ